MPHTKKMVGRWTMETKIRPTTSRISMRCLAEAQALLRSACVGLSYEDTITVYREVAKGLKFSAKLLAIVAKSDDHYQPGGK
jgi:hypothetical protein